MDNSWQYISSKSNPLLVRLAKLKDKKYRRAEGLFRFDGIKLFLEAAQFDAPIEYVLVSESASAKYCSEVDGRIAGAKRYIVSDDAFAKLTDEQSPEGIITVCSALDNIGACENYDSLAEEIAHKTVLMLESVRDTGNMGTIIRSSRAFGIDCLIVSTDCADLYNSKTIRAAMGALFSQRIVAVDSVVETVKALKKRGSRVFAAALDSNARKLGSFELVKGDVIVIGNEGHGLARETIDSCSECVFIPMESDSESLNAGIAASICMWELYKIKN